MCNMLHMLADKTWSELWSGEGSEGKIRWRSAEKGIPRYIRSVILE